jgi:two-component system phosphate regulon response regulator OmpR
MSEAAHILVVDDDDRIRTLVKRYLAREGHRVTAAEDAAHARRLLQNIVFDLIVLDIMMPGETGLELTRAIRAEADTPILLLTARGEPEDRIAGLRVGADDYLPKPFEPEELSLRIAAILRRAKPPPAQTELHLGDAVWNIERQELRREGVLVRLTDAEAGLMAALARTPGEAVSREELARLTSVTLDRSVDVQVTRLRRKLEEDAEAPIYLQTVRGVGYRLSPDP